MLFLKILKLEVGCYIDMLPLFGEITFRQIKGTKSPSNSSHLAGKSFYNHQEGVNLSGL